MNQCQPSYPKRYYSMVNERLSKSSDISSLLRPFLPYLGDILSLEAIGWDYPLASKVWELETQTSNFILKQSVNGGKFRQELRAYQEWIPQVSHTPKLIAFDETFQTLLISKTPGLLAETALQRFLENSEIKTWDRKQELEIHRQAGQWLKTIHNVPFVDNDSTPLGEAVLNRAKDWLKRAEPYVDSANLVWVQEQVENLLPFLQGKKRVPCHRDYTARNWLFNGTLYVIDFEHCRPEYWLFDLEKLWSEVWLERPELKEAFVAGYAYEWSEQDEACMRAFAALSAVTRIAWSLEQGENDYAVTGRKLLEVLRSLE